MMVAVNQAIIHSINNASIVSHDTYSVNPQTLQVINYPEGFTTITHAVNIWLLPKLKCIFVYPHRTVDMGDNYSELVQIINVEETTDDCLVYYYLPDGTIYTGGATVNGIPTEPLIDGNILKWSLPGMYPGQLYEIEFQVGATNPQQIELERRVRAWAYSTPINTELYADDFGILEINDDIPPTIGSVSHQIEGDTLSIYAQVTDNMKVDQVKVYITKPNQQTVNYNMVKSTGDLYKLILDISTWESGEYKYYIWAKDLAGNENESQEYTFLIVENLTADANGPYESIVGETIQFYGSAIAGASPYSWYWEFGDDSTSIEQNPTHVYVAPGNYTVTLTVTDNNDDTAIDTTWALIEENTPPNTPIIDGTTNGKAGNEYEYRFSSSDPEGHHISYYVDWGDGNDSGWIGPYASGEEVARSHIWQNRGGYIIRVKARDTLGEESDWATLEVSMPKNKAINPFLPFLERLIEQFPILEQILQLIYVYLG